MNVSRWWIRAETMAYESSIGEVGLQPAGLDPAPYGLGLAQSDLWVDGRIDRTVHGDDIFIADYLIELDVMDMSGRPAFRAMQDQQLLMRIDPHPGHPVALHAVADRQGMAAEDVGQQRHGLVTALWNVHPDQYVRAQKERLDVGDSCVSTSPPVSARTRMPAMAFTLDPKESLGSLPLSGKMKSALCNRAEHAPSTTLLWLSPDRPTGLSR